MKTLAAISLVGVLWSSLPAAAAAGTAWADGVAAIAGERFLGSEVPALKGVEALAARVGSAEALGPEAKGIYRQALGWADEIIRVDEELDAAHEAYRRTLAAEDAERIEALREERAYYSAVWSRMVDPAKDFEKGDPRVTPVLQAVLVYLRPLPERHERLSAGMADAAKAVESARGEARSALARLHEDDRRMVREAGLGGETLEKVEAAIPPERRESVEYLGWVKAAYRETTDWAEAVKRHESYAGQHARVEADFRRHAELAKALIAKKLGQPAAS